MTIRVLAIADKSDLPETHTMIGLREAGVGIEVLCAGSAPHRQRLIDAGVPLTTLDLRGRFDREGTRRIRQKLDAGSFDIVHAFNNRTVSNGLRATRGRDIRFVAYRGIVGNLSFLDPIAWTTYLNPRVDRIVCVADAVRQGLLDIEWLWLRLPREKPVTIYKGHDLAWYDAPPVARSSLGIPETAFVVGCTVNERPRKGLPYLIEAFRRMPADSGIHLLLIGNIQGAETFRAIDACPARDHIHLTGFRTDAPQVLGSANICILPALKREGLPRGIIEGMAYGVTPIVTDSGGSPELILPGECGLIVPPGDAQAITDAILELAGDPERNRRMGERARLRIEQDFNNRETVRQTLALYQSLVSRPASGTRPT